MNVICIAGRLVKAPEIIDSEKGTVAKFSVAVNSSSDPTFFDCVAFDKTANVVNDFTRKGSSVAIQGYMQQRKYEKDGEKRSAWQLVVTRLTLCGSDQQQAQAQEQPKRQAKSPRKAQTAQQDQEEFEY